MKKSLLVGFMLMLVGFQIVFPNVCSDVNSHQNIIPPSDEPDEYTITIYRCNGYHYEKIVTQIASQDAACMRKDFETIDQSTECIEAKVEEKISLLKQYHILPKDDPLETSLESYRTTNPLLTFLKNTADRELYETLSIPVVKRRELFGVAGFVQGEFSGPSLNFLNLIAVGVPLFILSISGSLTYLRLLAPFIRVSVSGDSGFLFLSMVFIGFIGLIPFLSPGGVIAGISLMSYCTSY